MLDGVSDAKLDLQLFGRVELHRNNRHYRLLIDICRLLHDLYLPAQTAGECRFRSLLDDEVHMHRIFEAFVRRFAQQHSKR
jgi:5-methylcytosine-specific restriction enzyme subunit McrC